MTRIHRVVLFFMALPKALEVVIEHYDSAALVDIADKSLAIAVMAFLTGIGFMAAIASIVIASCHH